MTTEATAGFPVVKVPVLSNTIVVILGGQYTMSKNTFIKIKTELYNIKSMVVRWCVTRGGEVNHG